MQYFKIDQTDLNASRLAMGCMRMRSLTETQVEEIMETALECGINFFDHADIYGAGKSEELFGNYLTNHPSLRDDIMIQSKCSITSGYYDFSKEHILKSVDGILKRLKTDYLDVLLLHRPDILMQPEEVAQAFHALQQSGKVHYFGVSNQNPATMELLQSAVSQKLVINQMQFGLAHTNMIDRSVNVNMDNEMSCDSDGGALEYCMRNKITMQAWSPFQYGMIEGVFFGQEKYAALCELLKTMAEEKGITDSALAISWILRHPAMIQPIIGSMNPKRLREISKACDVTLTRAEWYALYKAAGNQLP